MPFTRDRLEGRHWKCCEDPRGGETGTAEGAGIAPSQARVRGNKP
jgi:hypothetical protein